MRFSITVLLCLIPHLLLYRFNNQTGAVAPMCTSGLFLPVLTYSLSLIPSAIKNLCNETSGHENECLRFNSEGNPWPIYLQRLWVLIPIWLFCIPHNRAPLTVVKRNQLEMGFRTHTLPALIGLWLLKIMRFMEPATQTLIMISMWVDVMAFIDIRAVASHVAGNSYSENEWGFGQIITVTGWLPMVVQFGRAWRSDIFNTL
ncbi:hypothetical protein QBC45DRAFT_175109 [Copromyces sp. CBS 386.78]|nr:hypothetical protein QBC45DRAFT_175109 [Copromyces sp. CBS 386.78]